MRAGLDPDADATHLQLYANGRAVPIKLSVTGGPLTSSDYLEFYGQGLESTTDTAQTYYLTLADGAGTRVRSPFADVVSPPNGPSSFAYTIERKERMIYFSGLLNGDAENFFGQVVTTGQTVATIPVSRLDSETTGPTRGHATRRYQSKSRCCVYASTAMISAPLCLRTLTMRPRLSTSAVLTCSKATTP